MNHRFLAIAFLLALALPAGTSYVCLQWRKWQIKHTVKQRLLQATPPENRTLIKVSLLSKNTDLHWEEEGEFEYQGQMYDVAERQLQGDTLYLWCVWDHEESHLKRQLAQLSARLFEQDAPSKENREQLFHFFKILYFQPAQEWRLSYPAWVSVSIFAVKSGKSTLCRPIDLPPPRTAA